jgi:RNA polymerase sigma-70 factor (ECF subfamily)
MDAGPTVTSTTLLDGLRDPANHTVWDQYVERYRPLIVKSIRRVGVSADEAEDVAQAALFTFSEAYREGRYERDRGRLRSWLFGIVNNQVRSWRQSRRHRELQPESTADEAALHGAEAPDELEDVWEEEWRAAVLRQCMRQVRAEVEPKTMQIFECFALEGRPAEEVAAKFDTSPNAVFGAKRRILGRMKELMPFVEDVF